MAHIFGSTISFRWVPQLPQKLASSAKTLSPQLRLSSAILDPLLPGSNHHTSQMSHPGHRVVGTKHVLKWQGVVLYASGSFPALVGLTAGGRSEGSSGSTKKRLAPPAQIQKIGEVGGSKPMISRNCIKMAGVIAQSSWQTCKSFEGRYFVTCPACIQTSQGAFDLLQGDHGQQIAPGSNRRSVEEIWVLGIGKSQRLQSHDMWTMGSEGCPSVLSQSLQPITACESELVAKHPGDHRAVLHQNGLVTSGVDNDRRCLS